MGVIIMKKLILIGTLIIGAMSFATEGYECMYRI